jgi:hydroxymethylpyrimidine kinase/phosphomethylpyrimidine kinase
MVSTSGFQLLPQNAVREIRKHLLPITTVLTPNIPEAKLILSDAGIDFEDPSSIDGLVEIARAVQALGPKYVLIKGGHLPFRKDGIIACVEAEKELVVDILYGNGEMFRIEAPYQYSRNTHGTGCSLACESHKNLLN